MATPKKTGVTKGPVTKYRGQGIPPYKWNALPGGKGGSRKGKTSGK